MILELPTIAAAETMYKAEKGVTVRGVTVSGDAADVVRGLNSSIPVRVVGVELDQLAAMLPYLQTFPSQIHDAMILAIHDERGTEAIVTSDGMIDGHAQTVW